MPFIPPGNGFSRPAATLFPWICSTTRSVRYDELMYAYPFRDRHVRTYIRIIVYDILQYQNQMDDILRNDISSVRSEQ